MCTFRGYLGDFDQDPQYVEGSCVVISSDLVTRHFCVTLALAGGSSSTLCFIWARWCWATMLELLCAASQGLSGSGLTFLVRVGCVRGGACGNPAAGAV